MGFFSKKSDPSRSNIKPQSKGDYSAESKEKQKIGLRQVFEFAEEGFLTGGELGGDFDKVADVEIAVPS